MNPQFQQFQKQVRDQQEQLRRKQMMAAWSKQEKRKKQEERQKFQITAPGKGQADIFQSLRRVSKV